FRERRGGHKHLKKVLAGGLVGLLLLGIAAGSVVFRGGSIKGEYDPNLARNIADRLRTLNPEFLMVDSRARLWAIGALMMADHPLFGTGFSTAKFEYPKYQALFFEKYPDFPAGPTPKHSARLHNDYLQWGVECGAVGLTLLLWAVFVFFKTGWVWMVRANGLSPGARFQQSCFFVALFVVLMDAFFSFPAHIAPIAIFIPGLLMLWISQVESPVEEEISERKLAPNQRAIAAALIWTLLAVPVGFGRARPAGYVAQTGVFVPLLAQFVGRTHEGELEALSGDIKSEFERMRRQLSAGTLKSLADLNNFLDLIDVIEAKYEKVEEIIPFAGQGMFYAGDFEMRTHVFLTDYGREIKGTVDRLSKTSTPNEAKEIKERLVKVYKDLDEHLPRAERYYQDSLESYRWHGLYWTLGLVQWELSMRGGASSKLVDSARESLETGRRIFPNEDRFFLELDIALRVGDASEAVGLATELMRRNPGLLIDQVFPKIAERSVRRDRITGQMRLDPAMGEFFKILLPQLGSDRMDVLLYALTILDYGNSEDLAKAYATKAKENLSPLESVFIDYRVLKDRKDLEDLSEQLQIYREAIESATPPAPNT
ncbi:MAG: O-antigen ligase family protein, partial [Candidatus Omnitrophica bacterium]|nr:O-antigen ligase family protein [Candidatus Omnitrophota bacterium]